MSTLIPYFTLDNVMEAIELYKKAFEKVETLNVLMLDDVEGQTQFKGKVGHATIKIFDNTIFLSDKTDRELMEGNMVHFSLDLNSKEDLERAFKLLSDGGVVYQELEEQFWCDLSCYVKDKYGIAWSLFIGHK